MTVSYRSPNLLIIAGIVYDYPANAKFVDLQLAGDILRGMTTYYEV